MKFLKVGFLSLTILSWLFSVISFAEVYITREEAIRKIFPSLQKYKTEKRVLNGQPIEISIIIREGETIGWIVVLDEKGKIKPITFLIGIDKQSKVLDVYILEYRDIFGSEIKRRSFLKQFQGKSVNSPLRVGRDVDAVTQATISSEAAAAAVRKSLQIVEELRKRQ
jgi:Na+-translocating ferredoxin:NAD+ oxidoreductase RnfG subunit